MGRTSILAAACIVGGCVEHGRQEPAPNTAKSVGSLTVLYPPDPCVLPLPALQVVAVAGSNGDPPELTLDGQPLNVDRLRIGWTAQPYSQTTRPSSRPSEGFFERTGNSSAGRTMAGQTVLSATASLEPGEHRISVGGRQVRVFVQSSGNDVAPPADWPVFRLHPPADPSGRPVECSACHEIAKPGSGPMLGPPQTPDNCFSCHPPDDFELIHTHRVEVLTTCQMCHDPHGGTRPALLKGEAKALCSTCHE